MRRASQVFLLLSVLLLLGNVALRWDGTAVWDDAHFFTRYADNFLAHGNFAWNADEPATYGLTAPLFGVVIVVLRLLDGPVAAHLWLLSALFAVVAGLGVWRLVREGGLKQGMSGEKVWIGLGLVVAVQAPALAVHATSGMETTLAMAWTAGWLTLVLRFQGKLSPGRGLLLGALGGLLYLLRPELLLLTGGVPLVLLLGQRDALQRRMVAYWLLFTGAAVLACAFFALTFFGSPIPLSFFVKSLNPYGPEFTAQFRIQAWQYLGMFALLNALPLAAIVLSLIRHGRKWTRLNLALLAFVGLFLVYQTLGVLPVMGYHQRFLYPVWPVLIYLGFRAWNGLELGKSPFSTGLKAAMALSLAAGFALTIFYRPANLSRRIGHFSIAQIYTELGQHNWHLLDSLAAFPPDLHLASTELGILATMNPGKRITDLSGLNDPVLSLKFDPDYVVKRAPDLLYLPHPHNVTMQTTLLASSSFQQKYQIYPAEELGSYMGIAIRKDGKYFLELVRLVEDEGS